jgi:nuclear pore complex protein Nup205
MQDFIMDPLLSGIGQRRYGDPRQLFELADACIQHLVLAVRFMDSSNAATLAHPGTSVLLALLSPSNTLLRELMTHVLGASPGLQPPAADLLSQILDDSPVGPAAESAAISLLRLLTAVFDLDIEWVQHQRKSRTAVESLHCLLMQQPLWVLHLVQFIQPGMCPALQSNAARIAGFLSTRDAAFTHTLLTNLLHARKLVYNCTAVLAASLFLADTSASTAADDEAAMVAPLLLQLLLDNVSRPFPNLTQLLLGYTVHQARSCFHSVALLNIESFGYCGAGRLSSKFSLYSRGRRK